MENTDQIGTFRTALKDCFGLWSCRLDEGLNVTETNSDLPNLTSRLFLSQKRAEIIRRHTELETAPLILGAKIGALWSVITSGAGAEREVWALGPIFTRPVTRSMMENLIEPYHVSFDYKRRLLDCLSLVPVLPMENFFQFTVLFHYYVTGETVGVSNFIYNMPESQRREEERRAAHSPLINEHELLDRVRSGDLDYRGALSVAGTGSHGIRADIDPIRQAKYSVVAFLTLCARAAIEGGLSADIAYGLSDTYTEMVDACQSISETAAVSHTMYQDYITRVHRIKTAAGISRPIQASRDYIETHVTDAITVEELAERSGYAPYYFTKLFRAETGYGIKEYILRAKVEAAKRLLINTDKTVLEISETLKFSSHGYFTHQFEQIAGVSPMQFRKKNQKVN